MPYIFAGWYNALEIIWDIFKILKLHKENRNYIFYALKVQKKCCSNKREKSNKLELNFECGCTSIKCGIMSTQRTSML